MLLLALLSAVLLLLASPGVPAAEYEYPVHILVTDSVHGTKDRDYTAESVLRGSVFGAMKRLATSGAEFTFTYTENADYGIFVTSVNGQYANNSDHTYWQLLVEAEDGTKTIADVGVGCLIPKKGEQIILNFTKW